MRPHTRLFVGLYLLVVYLTGANLADAQKLLRWKHSEGAVFDVVVKQTMTQTMTIGEQTIEVPMEMQIEVTNRTSSVDESQVATQTQTIDRIQLTMTVPRQGDVKFDSDSRTKPEGLAKNIAEIMGPLVGADFEQKVNSQGKIVEINVPEEALKGFASNPLLKDFFSTKTFGEMMRRVSPELPSEQVAKQDTWTQKSDNKTPVGTMTVETEYTYEGEVQDEGRKLDKVTAQIDLAFAKGDSETDAKIEITEQESSGEMLFDSEAGYLAKSNMTQTIDMKVTVGDTTIDQSLETTVEMSANKR